LGGDGRDLLFGGLGADALFGNASDDILIAGTTEYDEAQLALQQLLTEWSSSAAFASRVGTLQAGTGAAAGGLMLNATTVFDDFSTDYLTGNAGADWFLANVDNQGVAVDQLLDEQSWEITTDIDLPQAP
jgi:Ca2+-binding RTX toxin-like protein